MKLSAAIIAIVVLTSALAGCSARSETRNINNAQTLGQELLDLQKAKESGAISEDDFEEMKEKLIKQRS